MNNFHTHTFRCMHASGRDEDYVLAAIAGGYKVLGFSDHSPWKYESDFTSDMRMNVSQFEDYYQSIRRLKEKYKDQIEIKIGLEVEYFPRYMHWIKKLIRDYQLDYVIFGNHYYETDELHIYNGRCTTDDECLDEYVKSTIEGLETGLYAYLAHPDLYMRSMRKWDEKAKEAAHKICAYCKEHDVIMEYNLAGLEYSLKIGVMQYPYDEFWKIASEYRNKVMIGVDAHKPSQLSDMKIRHIALEQLSKYDLELVDEISFFEWNE